MNNLLTFVRLSGVMAIIILFTFITGCKKNYTPKPRGYFRIEFPEKRYVKFDTTYPYLFEYPAYAKIVEDKSPNAEPYWINIVYPEFKGKVHISYKSLNNNIDQVTEDSRSFAYKHTVKADAINERSFYNPEKKVYGIFFQIKGDAASSVQFYVTDSISNFLRGSLYFDVVPNKDSLAPVTDFISQDILQLMESLEWKKLPK
jgi:gliding motility-associated lipoprotein GldD